MRASFHNLLRGRVACASGQGNLNSEQHTQDNIGPELAVPGQVVQMQQRVDLSFGGKKQSTVAAW